MNIILTDFGIANRYGDTIEINRNLKNYPELYNQVISHELRHTESSGFTNEDLILDLSSKINYWDIIKFMFKHPKSFFQFFPIYKRKGILFYDINLIIIYLIFFSVIGLSVFLAII